ncbi:MAG: integration host factor subunit beta [Paludibacteraceae bacterium]|jgi:DNA-binding protein HU-beta|nr:integration host factor subunit beta [Paludibacteraceae bacterium]
MLYICKLYEELKSIIIKLIINHLKTTKMTKADLVNEIAKNTGIGKDEVLKTVEAMMDTVKGSLSKGENVFLRGFGSFIVKRRAKKTARNISKGISIEVPAHNIPAFKPSKEFVAKLK